MLDLTGSWTCTECGKRCVLIINDKDLVPCICPNGIIEIPDWKTVQLGK